MLTLVVLVGVLLPGGAALFGRNTLSLNVEGFASDEYVSNEKYGVGLNNAISLNISLQGVFGTITSVDEEIEHDIDTLELYKKLSENIFDTVPKWLVLKPPEEFPVRSISVVEPHNCTGTSLTSGRQNFSFFQAGKRYVLQLPELPNLECSGLKVHVATRNPAELLYAYDSRWKAYLVSNNAMQHDFYDSSKPWKRSLIADGYWRGIFPLKSKVCGLFSEWTMNSSILCPLGSLTPIEEGKTWNIRAAFLAPIIYYWATRGFGVDPLNAKMVICLFRICGDLFPATRDSAVGSMTSLAYVTTGVRPASLPSVVKVTNQASAKATDGR